jgi:hypothetical protein
VPEGFSLAVKTQGNVFRGPVLKEFDQHPGEPENGVCGKAGGCGQPPNGMIGPVNGGGGVNQIQNRLGGHDRFPIIEV